MRKLFFLAVFLLSLNGEAGAHSQVTEKPYRVGASLGYSFTGYREETYSPLNMFLNTLTFIVDGNIEKGRFLHSLNMGFYMGDADTANPATAVMSQHYDHSIGEAYDFAHYPQYLAVRGNLEYALDRRLWGNEVFPGYLGGAFRADAYMQFAYYPSITGIVSLGVHATQKWIVNPQSRFVLSMGIPIFGYAVRPPFAGSDAALMKYAEENPIRIITLGEVASLHNYWAVFGNLQYHHAINTLLSLNYGLGFELSRINTPRPRRDAILRLNAGLSFTFDSKRSNRLRSAKPFD